MDNQKNNDARVPTKAIEDAKQDIVGTISKYLDLKKAGKDYSALCPFHSERTPSFTVSEGKGIYQCFGCGAHGDAIDFVIQHEGIAFHEAVQSIVGNMVASGSAPGKKQVARTDAEEEWRPITPVPDDAREPMNIFHRRKGDSWEKLQASRSWVYRDADGRVLGYVCRFELPGGGKDLIPQSYCINSQTGEVRWKWLSFAKPRPIYGLDKLAQYPRAQVIVIEGEKACDAAQDRYEEAGITRDKLITVAWPGGGKAVKHVDWTPLTGRTVGLWPDADQKPYVDSHPKAGELMPLFEQPGTVCMVDIASRLEGLSTSIKFIMPPKGVPDGWDLADDLPEGFNLLQHTKSSAMPIAEFLAQNVQEQVAQPDDETPPWEEAPHAPALAPAGFDSTSNSAPLADSEGDPEDDTQDGENQFANNKHFRALGVDGGTYYFFKKGKRNQILELSTGGLTMNALLSLAPLNWWEMQMLGVSADGKFKKDFAVDCVMQACEQVGIFDPTFTRGRGAWFDQGRMVIHIGDRLLVDGQVCGLGDIDSEYLYRGGRRIAAPAKEALTIDEGKWLQKVAGMFRWGKPASPLLLCGWLFLSPLCGALRWRPHAWLSGGAGSGKSSVMNYFVRPLIPNGMELYANGDSTEAGLRQALNSDARPILIDESESDGEKAKEKIERIIVMLRQSSSDSGAQTFRGTVSGDAQAFSVRTMALLSSIGVALERQQDRERVVQLDLRSKRDGVGTATDVGDWPAIKAELNKIGRDETISARMFARSVGMAAVVMQAIDVFTEVAANHLGTAREGDQTGALLAGAWCMTNDEAPTHEQAAELMGRYDWSLYKEDSVEESDELISTLLSRTVMLSGGVRVSIGKLISRAAGNDVQDLDIKPSVADSQLHNYGMRVSGGWLLVHPRNTELLKLMKETKFSTDLRGRMKRIKDATTAGGGGLRIGMVNTNGVKIPLSEVLGDVPKEYQEPAF